MKIGGNIVALREAKGWTQGQLAAYSKVPQSYVSRLERDEHPNVAAVVLDKLARALGVTIDYLLHGDPVRPETASEIGIFINANPSYREFFDFARANHFSDAQMRRVLRLAQALVEYEEEEEEEG